MKIDCSIVIVFAASSNSHALPVEHIEEHNIMESRVLDPSSYGSLDHDVPQIGTVKTRHNLLSHRTVGIGYVGEFKEPPAFAVDKMQTSMADEVQQLATAAQEMYTGEQQLESKGFPQALPAARPTVESLEVDSFFKQWASIHIWLVVLGLPAAVLALSQWVVRRPSNSEKQRSINAELTFSYQLDQATRGTWMKGLFEVGLNARLRAEANDATKDADKALLCSEPSSV